MQRTRRTIGWTLGAVLVAALALTSFKAFAEPAFSRHIAGSYRVVMMYQGQQLPYVATFTADGGVMSTFVPLTCATSNDPTQPGLFTVAHGSWDVSMMNGRPVLQFNLLSDQWAAPVVLNPDGTIKAQNAYMGTVQIGGAALLTTGPVKGRARIQFPDAFQGGCSQNPIDVDFVAERIPPAPAPEIPDK